MTVGRFAPSPTGPLHDGGLAAALASWLDARRRQGRWLVRIEDIDPPRCVPGADQVILSQLAAVGLVSDDEPVHQSERGSLYERALATLRETGWAYDCACSRRDIEQAWASSGRTRQRHVERVYPGTCRPEHGGLAGRASRAVRCRTATQPTASHPWGSDIRIDWFDEALGAQHQNVTQAVGDFVLRRADGLCAYQLAVVVDDADQGVTTVVRGRDLLDNTARQIHLQQLLGLPRPRYTHVPLVLAADGDKLSKQNGAQAVDLSEPATALRRAGHQLGLALEGRTVGDVLSCGIAQYGALLTEPRTGLYDSRPA